MDYIELSKDEIERIISWFGCVDSEGYDDSIDWELKEKLETFIEEPKEEPE